MKMKGDVIRDPLYRNEEMIRHN